MLLEELFQWLQHLLLPVAVVFVAFIDAFIVVVDDEDASYCC